MAVTDRMDDEDRDQRSSDHPSDLTREREAFVRQFLRKGVEVTESLLEENREIREELQNIQVENARLRAQVASDDAIRDLLKKIEQLEVERRSLLQKSDQLAEWTRQSEVRTHEIEQELHDLANLYIASSHLHATLSVRGVVKHLSELLQQLMGAERYVIYLLDRSGTIARPIVAAGLGDLGPVQTGDVGAVAVALTTGVPRIREEVPLRAGTMDDPLAIVPMMVRDTCVGAIVVVSTLTQKEKWAAVDQALFDFLGSHAGTALIAANQYAAARDARAALDGIDRHLVAGGVDGSAGVGVGGVAGGSGSAGV